MKSSPFQSRLLNHLFGDPGLFVALRFSGEAVLFDLGRLDRLPASEILKVRWVFVTHTHMDHFIGFDHLLRLFLARDSEVDLFGPEGVIDNVAGKLRGYTWNLVDGYPFVLTVHEIAGSWMRSVRFPATRAFRAEELGQQGFDGVAVRADGFTVHAAALDHRIVSLGYSLQEDTRFNVRPEELERLELDPGPWLNTLKAAIRRGDDDETIVAAQTRDGGGRKIRLGDVRESLVAVTPGQKLAYVTDTVFSAANAERIVDLVRDADLFYCESLFVDEDRDQARKRFHLTARQAGTLARRAGVQRLETFHYSPRYDGDAERLQREAQATFNGAIPLDEPD